MSSRHLRILRHKVVSFATRSERTGRAVHPVLERLEDRAVPTHFGSLLEYTIPAVNGAGIAPWDIASGPDGNIWFTGSASNTIGQYNSTIGSFQEWNIPTANSVPYAITSGVTATGDTTLYFTEYQGGNLGQVTIGNGGSVSITEAPVLDQNGKPVQGTQLVGLATAYPDFARVTQANSPVVTGYDLSVTPPHNDQPRHRSRTANREHRQQRQLGCGVRSQLTPFISLSETPASWRSSRSTPTPAKE